MGWLWAAIAAGFLLAIVQYVRAQGGKATNARLRGFGVVVDGDQVKAQGNVLGPLAGAHAEIGQVTSRHTLTRVATGVGALTKKTNGDLFVTFTNGYVHSYPIRNATDLRQASRFVVQFNALAGRPTA